ncbi:MAG: tetratricopeptide repeat protein [Phycisphaerae bacterium]|nr:tetratricopeptide repeat protein [Phycisphaerae bacterium]
MARSTRKREVDSGGFSEISKTKALAFAAGLTVLAVLGVWLINRTTRGARILDVEALEREQAVRTASMEALTQSEELIQEGKLAEAQALVERVTESDPNFYLGHVMLGYLYMQMGKAPLALQVTQRALALEPDDPTVNYQMGQAESLMGNLDSAIDHVAKAIRVREKLNLPGAPEYHITLADAFARSGQPRLAAQQMETALEADRSGAIAAAEAAGPEAQAALARVLLKRQEVAEGARLYARIAMERPDRADWQYQAARAYMVLGRFDQAETFIEKAVDLDPSNAAYVQLKGQIAKKEIGPSLELGEEDQTEESEQSIENLFQP